MTQIEVDRTLDAMIGARVRRLMKERAITQTAFAPRLGIAQSVLGRKLAGKVTWSARDIVNAATLLGTTSAYLLGERAS